jgi:ribose transport system permease protein
VRNSRVRRFGRSGLGLIPLGLPVLMFVLLSLRSPDFFELQNIANVNSQVTALLIVALGQLLVALIGGIDISVGSVLSLTSALIVSIANPLLAIGSALAASLVIGGANGIGVTIFGVHPLIMTLASMTFVQGFTLLVLPAAGGSVPEGLTLLAKASVAGFPAAFFWCVAVSVLASVLLYRSRFGLRIFAIGADSESAALNGVNIVIPRIACYILCSLGSAVAGIYLTGRISSGDPTMGQPFSLDSVTAIALGGVQLAGGVGSVIGAVLGTVTLGLIANGMNLLGVSPFLRAALTGLLLLGAISLQRRRTIGI